MFPLTAWGPHSSQGGLQVCMHLLPWNSTRELAFGRERVCHGTEYMLWAIFCESLSRYYVRAVVLYMLHVCIISLHWKNNLQLRFLNLPSAASLWNAPTLLSRRSFCLCCPELLTPSGAEHPCVWPWRVPGTARGAVEGEGRSSEGSLPCDPQPVCFVN